MRPGRHDSGVGLCDSGNCIGSRGDARESFFSGVLVVCGDKVFIDDAVVRAVRRDRDCGRVAYGRDKRNLRQRPRIVVRPGELPGSIVRVHQGHYIRGLRELDEVYIRDVPRCHNLENLSRGSRGRVGRERAGVDVRPRQLILKGEGRAAQDGNLEPLGVEFRHAHDAGEVNLIAGRVAVRRRRDNGGFSRRDGRNVYGGLQHMTVVTNHAHIFVAELQDVLVGSFELELDEPREDEMVFHGADE